MSMTRTEARNYIAGIISGSSDPKLADLAEQALRKGFDDWLMAASWEFLLKDTSLGFSVTGVSGNTDTFTTGIDNFDAVNIGVSVTITGGGVNATLPAGTTVLSYTRGSTGNINSITLSNPVAGSVGSFTLNFGGDIPIIAGVQDYNLPSDFNASEDAKLIGSNGPSLRFIRHKFWHLTVANPLDEGAVEAYTVFNPYSALTQSKGSTRLRLYRIPSASDTLRLTYYRKFDSTADPLDMDESYLRTFLDYCRAQLLALKRAQDDPITYIKLATAGFENAQSADKEAHPDEEPRMISQMDAAALGITVWANGPFDNYYGG